MKKILLIILIPVLLACDKKSTKIDPVFYQQERTEAFTIESDLKIFIAGSVNGYWGHMGMLPGVVDIPDCEDLVFKLVSLNRSNMEDYKNVINKYKMKSVALTDSVTASFLKECVEAGVFEGVESISLINCDILFNIKPLKQLPSLREISLPTSSFINLKSLSKVPQIQIVTVWNCDDLEPFKKMKNLKGLHLLQSENLDNISVLAELPGIEELRLGSCSNLSDFSPLGEMDKLRILTVYSNSYIKDTEFFSRISGLEELSLKCNNLEDISSLSELSSLKVLSLNSIKLRNISSLSELSGLKKLEFMDCYNVSNEKVEELKSALPGCEVVFTYSPG